VGSYLLVGTHEGTTELAIVTLCTCGHAYNASDWGTLPTDCVQDRPYR
jgi:hypothetical protein